MNRHGTTADELFPLTSPKLNLLGSENRPQLKDELANYRPFLVSKYIRNASSLDTLKIIDLNNN